MAKGFAERELDLEITATVERDELESD